MDNRLTITDAERLAEWFLDRMPMEQRRQLMADMPLVYARVFPDVRHDSITAMVSRELAEQAVTTAERE